MADRKIFVITEYKKNQNVFSDLTFELLTLAVELKRQARENYNFELEVCATVLDSGIDADFNMLAKYGADNIFYVKNEKLRDYNLTYFSSAILELIKMKNPEIVLFPASTVGRELAPSVTSRLQTGLTADCTSCNLVKEKDKVKLAATRPTFGGVLMATILCKENPQCATFRQGVITKSALENFTTRCEEIPLAHLFETSSPIKNVEFIANEIKKSTLEDAKVIFCGGKGLKTKENFEKLRRLTEILGISLAASRGAVDLGLAEQEIQVGQTGKTVCPDLYVAFGVSGAVHHISGMSASSKVVAINKDENAPIFENCDYKIVADAVEIIDEMLKKLSSC